MRIIATILSIFFLNCFLFPQVPLQYYDFEVNGNRSIAEFSAEILINSISGTNIISAGGIFQSSAGNPASGNALIRDDWDENGLTDPGAASQDYIEFNLNTDGFRGISIMLDAQASILLNGPSGNINLLYSANGGSDFNALAPQPLSTTFNSYTWDLASSSGLDNNSSIVIRIYVYGDITGAGTVSIDNLGIYAKEIIASKTLGNYQAIDDANGAGTFPEFSDFIINGSAAEVILTSNIIFNDTLSLLEGKIITTNSFAVKLTAAATVSGYSENSFIAGNFTHSWTSSTDGTKFFPIGTLNSYRPVEITTGFIETGGSITIKMTDSNPGYSGLPSGVNNISSVRYWTVLLGDGITFNPINGLYGIKLFWGTDDGINNPSDAAIVRGIAGGVWTEESNTGFNVIQNWILGSFNNPSNNDFTFGDTGGTNPLPVELSSFTARSSENKIFLSWKTETETNSYAFEVQKNSGNNSSDSWNTIGIIRAKGNTNSENYYNFSDEKPYLGNNIYRLKVIDADGTYEFSKTVEIFNIKPDEFSLKQNYPNPFNPSTAIAFDIPEDGFVKLKIYNLIGELVESLYEGYLTAGTHTFNWNASGATGGIYLYNIAWNGINKTKRMTLLK